MKGQMADPDVQQVPGARIAIQREEYIQAVLDLRQLVDKTSEAYDGIAKDPEIKDALADQLCRCGVHNRVVRAVRRVAVELGK